MIKTKNEAPMNYVEKLTDELNTRMQKLINQMSGKKEENEKTPNELPPIPLLLKAALKNEWETTLLTSNWVSDEEDSEFRISLARLAGDEAKHFELIKGRLVKYDETISLEELNIRTPMYSFLREQKSTFDRVVTGPFTREALAVARNELFLDYCKKREDSETISIYKIIQEDESHHHQLGKTYLNKLIKNEDDYQKAYEKMMALLDIVEDIQEMIVIKKGLSHIPGC